MTREELVSSAVTFLQDPSVASSPVEKRIAFLQSKNLTQEEIDLALARAGEGPSATAVVSSQAYPASQQAVYRSPPTAQGYGYPPYGQWQPPPPAPPRRDWRDYFIMATVMGGVGYGIYFVAKRYIAPLIAPPTPPQLEQDKENIDEQFSRAFALIEQLSTDTASLKSAEEARTERLDAALREIEFVVADLKNASRRRDDDTRRIQEEVKALQSAIPRSLEGAREGNENRLRELSNELRSLKTLLGHRLGGSGTPGSSAPGRTAGVSSQPGTPRPAEEPTTSASGAINGVSPAASAEQVPQTTPAGKVAQAPSASQGPGTNPLGHGPLSQLGRSASIPAWQMAAASRSKSGPQPSVETPTAETPSSDPVNEQQGAPAS